MCIYIYKIYNSILLQIRFRLPRQNSDCQVVDPCRKPHGLCKPVLSRNILSAGRVHVNRPSR